MERKFNFAPEEYFHIYNRGTEKRKIFLDKNDYKRFLKCLYLCNSINPIKLRNVSKEKTFYYEREETIVDIGAYCLMPNHFHVLIRAKKDGGVSSFMEKIQTAYSMYFNKKYQRTGSLFQGPFKAQHVARDEYLKYLFAYIHLNPIKIIDPEWKENGITNLNESKKFIDSYIHSSYQDYLDNERSESKILNKKSFPIYFENSKSFESFLYFWLSFKEEEE